MSEQGIKDLSVYLEELGVGDNSLEQVYFLKKEKKIKETEELLSKKFIWKKSGLPYKNTPLVLSFNLYDMRTMLKNEKAITIGLCEMMRVAIETELKEVEKWTS